LGLTAIKLEIIRILSLCVEFWQSDICNSIYFFPYRHKTVFVLWWCKCKG